MEEIDTNVAERPIRRIRRLMLERLIEEFGGVKPLADLLGKTPDNHLTTIRKGRRNIGDDLATALEAATGKPHGWMDGALSDQALEIALKLDSIADPAEREVAMALAYTAAFRRHGQAPR
jgi:hypothetical protein